MTIIPPLILNLLLDPVRLVNVLNLISEVLDIYSDYVLVSMDVLMDHPVFVRLGWLCWLARLPWLDLLDILDALALSPEIRLAVDVIVLFLIDRWRFLSAMTPYIHHRCRIS